MMHIGILGGSFDPVHNGHLHAADVALIQMALDVVYFMPTAKSPFKQNNVAIATDVQRLKMLEVATQHNPKIEVLDWEILRRGVSYTYDTAVELTQKWPNMRFFWIIGEDMVDGLYNWHKIGALATMVEFLVIHRPGTAEITVPPIANLKVHPLKSFGVDISSTEVREKARRGESIKELVPAAVNNYININQIYKK